jgi:hypothetical protein
LGAFPTDKKPWWLLSFKSVTNSFQKGTSNFSVWSTSTTPWLPLPVLANPVFASSHFVVQYATGQCSQPQLVVEPALLCLSTYSRQAQC